jgi:hypothetical protein
MTAQRLGVATGGNRSIASKRPHDSLARGLRLAVTLAIAWTAACRGRADDGVCRCTPANLSRTKLADGSTLDGPALVGKLRRHRRDVAEHRPPRDIKVFDDELRFEVANFCQPCSEWVQDRMTIEEMFPLQRLDDAASAVCLGLVLRDGTLAYGDARPAACR